MMTKINKPNSPKPFVAYDDIENILSMEWYHGEHQLHIEIGEICTTYIKVWGTNIEHQMEVEEFKPGKFPKLWEWLIEG